MPGIDETPGEHSSDAKAADDALNQTFDGRNADKPLWFRLAWLPISLLIVIMAVFAHAKLTEPCAGRLAKQTKS